MSERRERRFPSRIGDILKVQSDSKLWHGVYEDLDQLLRSGAALTGRDRRALLISHGIPELNTSVYLKSEKWIQETIDHMRDEGVSVEVIKYKGRKIWVDSSLDMKDTYLDVVLQRIEIENNRINAIRAEVTSSLPPELAKVF